MTVDGVDNIELLGYAYKHCFSKHLRFLALAEKVDRHGDKYQEYKRKAASYSEKCRAIDSRIQKLLNIKCQAATPDAVLRWIDFGLSEQEYRSRLVGPAISQRNDVITGGLLKNSVIREDILIKLSNDAIQP